ncbi:MAG: hypothetical protein JG775_2188, partial [Defluviitaleaceae bacterium]|nr:hypothetical protein [Defluviitaleaceae bacterium]
ILLSNNKAHINTIVTEHSLDLEDIQSIDIGHFISFSTEDVADVTDVGGLLVFPAVLFKAVQMMVQLVIST